MNQSYSKFCQILNDTKGAQSIYDYITNVVKPPYDSTDLLRWQWAQAVSALDKLIHDLVRCGMIEIYQGNRVSTPKYQNFAISLDILSEIRSNPTNELQIIEKHIIIAHGYKAFQEPDKISEALSYIWLENHKWEKIAALMGGDSHTVKTFLKNIIIRRNQIVHEGDYNGYSFQRQSMSATDVKDVIDFLSTIGKSIYLLVM